MLIITKKSSISLLNGTEELDRSHPANAKVHAVGLVGHSNRVYWKAPTNSMVSRSPVSIINPSTSYLNVNTASLGPLLRYHSGNGNTSINLGNMTANSTRTLAALILPVASISSEEYFAGMRGHIGGGAHLTIGRSDSNQVIFERSEITRLVTGPTLTLNKIYFVVATYDAPNSKQILYLDGINVGENTLSGNISTDLETRFHIGSNYYWLCTTTAIKFGGEWGFVWSPELVKEVSNNPALLFKSPINRDIIYSLPSTAGIYESINDPQEDTSDFIKFTEPSVINVKLDPVENPRRLDNHKIVVGAQGVEEVIGDPVVVQKRQFSYNQPQAVFRADTSGKLGPAPIFLYNATQGKFGLDMANNSNIAWAESFPPNRFITSSGIAVQSGTAGNLGINHRDFTSNNSRAVTLFVLAIRTGGTPTDNQVALAPINGGGGWHIQQLGFGTGTQQRICLLKNAGGRANLIDTDDYELNKIYAIAAVDSEGYQALIVNGKIKAQSNTSDSWYTSTWDSSTIGSLTYAANRLSGGVLLAAIYDGIIPTAALQEITLRPSLLFNTPFKLLSITSPHATKPKLVPKRDALPIIPKRLRSNLAMPITANIGNEIMRNCMLYATPDGGNFGRSWTNNTNGQPHYEVFTANETAMLSGRKVWTGNTTGSVETFYISTFPNGMNGATLVTKPISLSVILQAKDTPTNDQFVALWDIYGYGSPNIKVKANGSVEFSAYDYDNGNVLKTITHSNSITVGEKITYTGILRGPAGGTKQLELWRNGVLVASGESITNRYSTIVAYVFAGPVPYNQTVGTWKVGVFAMAAFDGALPPSAIEQLQHILLTSPSKFKDTASATPALSLKSEVQEGPGAPYIWTSRTNPTKYQPDNTSIVNYNNPLTKGLIFYTTNNSLVKRNSTSTLASAISRKTFGWNTLMGSSATDGFDANNMSMIVRPYLLSAYTGYESCYVGYYVSSSDDFGFGFSTDAVTASAFRVMARINSSSYSNSDASFSLSYPYNNHLRLSVTSWNPDNANTLLGYLNGDSSPTVSTHPVGAYYKNDTRKKVGLSIPVQYLLVYNRVISSDEDKELMKNPWQFLKPAMPRKIYVFPKTIATRNRALPAEETIFREVLDSSETARISNYNDLRLRMEIK